MTPLIAFGLTAVIFVAVALITLDVRLKEEDLEQGEGQRSAPSPVEDLRRASSRLVVALLLIAAGAALLIFLTVRWLGTTLQTILS